MIRRIVLALAAVALSPGCFSAVAHAGVQASADVGWITSGNWTLVEEDGRVGLIPSPPVKPLRRYPKMMPRWSVSAPTVQDAKGRFLATDPAGVSKSVVLVGQKCAHSRWAFEIIERINPGSEDVGGRQKMKSGPSGLKFKMKVDAGPFEGWFLAAGDDPGPLLETPGDGPTFRPLVLVKDPEQAATFTYTEKEYWVHHN